MTEIKNINHMKKLIFVIAFLLLQQSVVMSKDQPLVQINYVLKQLGEKIQQGEYKPLKVMLSKAFRVGKYSADLSDNVMVQLLAQAKFGAFSFADIEQKNGKVYASVKTTLADGKAIVGKVKLNENLEVERLGVFDQLLEINDPVAYELTKPTNAIHVPITRSAGMMFIKVKVNGSRELNFLFDSGAATTAVDTKIAKDLGLKIEEEVVKVGTSSGSGSYQTFKDPVYTVGTVNVATVSGILSDLSGFTPIMGVPVDGIIGQDILRDLLVEVNFDNNELNIYNGGNLDWMPGNVEHFKVRFSSGTPKIELAMVAAGETYKGSYLFDTGAGAALSVNGFYNFKNNLNRLLGNSISSASLDLAGNKTESNIGQITAINLGKFSLKAPQVSISVEPEAQIVASRDAGLLGMGILGRFNMLFNNQQFKVSLSPNKTFNDPFVPVYKLGMGLSWAGEQKFFVAHLNTSGQAYLAGLRNKDQVVKVNGHAPDQLNDILKELKTLQKADLKLEVTRDNSVKVITLKKLSN
jgi:predicted aspartyl protease